MYRNRKKYDTDYAYDVNMWELVELDEDGVEWNCMGIYAENEFVAEKLADLFEANYALTMTEKRHREGEI